MGRFKVGDEVERVSGGEWLGMAEGDTGTITEVIPTENNWALIKVSGFDGVYSDFRFRAVSPPRQSLSSAEER